MSTAAALYAERNKMRRRVEYFAALIATPSAVPFTLPEGGKFRIVATAGVAAGTTALTVTGPEARTIEVPALSTGEYMDVDWLPRDAGITIAANFELYVNTRFEVYELIGT